MGYLDMVVGDPPDIFKNNLEDVKSNFRLSPFSSLLAIIALKPNLWQKKKIRIGSYFYLKCPKVGF